MDEVLFLDGLLEALNREVFDMFSGSSYLDKTHPCSRGFLTAYERRREIVATMCQAIFLGC